MLMSLVVVRSYRMARGLFLQSCGLRLLQQYRFWSSSAASAARQGVVHLFSDDWAVQFHLLRQQWELEHSVEESAQGASWRHLRVMLRAGRVYRRLPRSGETGGEVA